MQASIRAEKKFWQRWGSLVLAILLLGMSLSTLACSREKQEQKPAAYGAYGVEVAERFVKQFPYRRPYTEQERAARDFIVGEIKALGYEPEIQAVPSAGDSGLESSNILVHIQGAGFYRDEEPLPGHDPRVGGHASQPTEPNLERREVLIVAHYDDAKSLDDQEAFPDYDGIHESGASVGVLLLFLKELDPSAQPYDITLAFLGAGNDRYRGAEVLLESLDEARRGRIDCVFTVESIYAGDKLYGHAGHNSVGPHRYDMRYKLYQTTDVALEYDLNGEIGSDLLTNQGGYPVQVPGREEPTLYREFTLRNSDYRVFDEAGLPVLYFESANYNVDAANKVIDSIHPAFSNTSGSIFGTNHDSFSFLKEQLKGGQLELRINTVAFLLLHVLPKGTRNYRSASTLAAEAVDRSMVKSQQAKSKASSSSTPGSH